MNINSVCRKTRKLFRNPKQFFMDSKLLNTKKGKSQIPQEILVKLGDNWESDMKVAVLFGFAWWKTKFIYDYLKDYRVLYTKRGISWSKVRSKLNDYEDFTFFVWSYTDSNNTLKQYAKERNIPIVRVEDGFLRSVELGKDHSLPYSLAFDSVGLYFNARQPSELEDILQNYDFAANRELLEKSRGLIALFNSLRLGKYNTPSHVPVSTVLGLKVRKRVLVMGQMMKDASIIYGDAGDWNNEKLIALAAQENPDAEIYYRPHPDMGDAKQIDPLPENVKLLAQDVNLADLFGEVDHVYVITSLSGFEALLHGLKVSVVGMPFYAGWGLTDDRQTCERRTRKLTLEEIFCGAYLLYPKYFIEASHAVEACLATMLRMYAERYQATVAQFSTKFLSNPKNIVQVAKTPFMPVILRNAAMTTHMSTHGVKLFSIYPLENLFSRGETPFWDKVLACYLAGFFIKNIPLLNAFLNILPGYVTNTTYKEVLAKVWDVAPSKELRLYRARAYRKDEDYTHAQDILFQNLTGNELPAPRLQISKSTWDNLQELSNIERERMNLEAEAELCLDLLITGYTQPIILQKLAEIASFRFDFFSAARICSALSLIFPTYKKYDQILFQLCRNWALYGKNPDETVNSLIFASWINVNNINKAFYIIEGLRTNLHHLPLKMALFLIKNQNERNKIDLSNALQHDMQANLAENILLKYTPSPNETVSYALSLSRSLSYQNKYDEAIKLIQSIKRQSHTPTIYFELMRLGIMKGDYRFCREILEEAHARSIKVNDIFERKIALGLGEIRKSYASFRQSKYARTVKRLFGDRYVQTIAAIPPDDDSILICAYFGPGDEIRFASFYPKTAQMLAGKKVSFTCDPRLYDLLTRGMPHLEFHPVKRLRSLFGQTDLNDFIKLPSTELHALLDNAGWALTQTADKILLSTDIVADAIDDKTSFAGLPYLKADPDVVEMWREKLEPYRDKGLLIGVSWRSGLVSLARNEHYFSIEEISPIFEVPGIQFVNLQYDECSEELAWVEEHFPGKLINFSELDQYNDLDGTGALMGALDLVIAPATTVIELAGALGRPAWLLSNSSELHWRKIDKQKTDIWHNTVRHVEGAILGDKQSLVRSLVRQLSTLTMENIREQRKHLEGKPMEYMNVDDSVFIPDDNSLLELMMRDYESITDKYFKWTNYWDGRSKIIAHYLKTNGLKDFRRVRVPKKSPGYLLHTFGATDLLSPKYNVTELYNKADIIGKKSYSIDLSNIMPSTVGNPEVFYMGGRPYTVSWLNFYIRYSYVKQFFNFDNAVIVEIGSGSGKQAELLLKAHPNSTILIFDNPPILYIANQYLKKVFPNNVIDYRETQSLNRLTNTTLKKGIYIFPTWKINICLDLKIDLFWNAASFQEMEPHIVDNYLSYIKHAKFIYLMEAMYGQDQASRPGEHGVLEKVTLNEYFNYLFNSHRLIDLTHAELATPTDINIFPYYDSIWKHI